MTTPRSRTYTNHDTRVKCLTMGTRNPTEPPRSTAYYYADLERLKRNDQSEPRKPDQAEPADELSEYVEANDVINDGPIREVPPLRDRNCSLEHSRKGETYSTAGTFPMPETKEKEPLLAELEVVGRLPLTQLDGAGVRRSRSWFCCPDVEEEISRESSWRYSSLRPVTAPPAPGQNGMNGILVAACSRGEEGAGGAGELASLRAEREALARALAAERRRAAEAARAHDARLAELHGVIAELVRRRAADKHARAIPEEEHDLDECESSTQPAGELEGEEPSSSALSPEDESPAPPAPRGPEPSAPTIEIRVEGSPLPEPPVASEPPAAPQPPEPPRECECDTSLDLSERGSGTYLSTHKCCRARGAGAGSGGSCDRERGSSDAPRVYTASPGRSEARQAKLASRVRLRRTDSTESTHRGNQEEAWCSQAAEQLALEVCAQADLREALLAANNDGATLTALLALSRARCQRLQADVGVLQCALAAATDSQHRLYCACCVLEQRCVSLCAALRAADRALETYDVVLALAETTLPQERAAAELVARQLVAALDAEQAPPTAIGGPLLSPGPWLQHDHQTPVEEWSAECEARLRSHAARLKADTVSLRPSQPLALFSLHDGEGEGGGGGEGESGAVASALRLQDMEAAVMMQEVLEGREAAAARALHAQAHAHTHACSRVHTDKEHKRAGGGGGGRRRHWLEQASETDL